MNATIQSNRAAMTYSLAINFRDLKEMFQMSNEARKSVKVARWDNPIPMCCDMETRDAQGREMSPSGFRRCNNSATAVIVENETAIAFRCEYHWQS